MYNILQAKADLTGQLHGTTLNQIQNLYGVFDRAARTVVQDVNPNETKRVIQLPLVYPYVYDYPGIPDLKGDKIIDIAPQTPRYPSDVFLNTTGQNFSLNKGNNNYIGDLFTIKWNNGVKTLRVNESVGVNVQTPITLNNADLQTNGNGTWTASGGATTPTTDYQNYFTGSGSLMFNLTSGTTGALTNSTSSSVSLATTFGQGTIFIETYLPTASAFTSVTLQFGSSASNYYSVTTSVTQQNTAFINGWNLLAFPTSSATVTGTPNNAAITYISVIWNYTTQPQYGVRLNNIVYQIGNVLNCTYYSKFLFQNAQTLAFQELVTDDSNIVNLDTDAQNLFLYKAAEMCAQQQQGLDALFYDATYFSNEYDKALAKYKQQYKSEEQKQQVSYYTPRNNNPSRYIGTRLP